MGKYPEKPQQVGAEYRRLEKRIEESEGLETDELMALLFERASKRYETLEIRDEDIRAAEMKEALAGREEIKEFDEELYRKLIKQILVYKDDTVRVVFHNNSSMKIGYQ